MSLNSSRIRAKSSYRAQFRFQAADVKDLTDVSSGYVEGPFSGTRYVYYQFTYMNKRMRIPTFTAKSMHFLTATVVQKAIAEADSFRDAILELQQKQGVSKWVKRKWSMLFLMACER